MINNPFLYLSIIIFASLSGAAHAQDSSYHPALIDNFNLSVGAFRSDNAFKLGAGSNEVKHNDTKINQSVGVDESSTIGNL